MLQRVMDRALQTHGGLGMTDDTPIAWWFRHERAARIYEKLLLGTDPGSAERARLAYEIAESWRRGGALDRADEAYAAAAEAVRAASLEGSDLDARLSLLRFHIDHDRGECREAVSSLERFLEEHPESSLASPARTTLYRLKQSESCA